MIQIKTYGISALQANTEKPHFSYMIHIKDTLRRKTGLYAKKISGYTPYQWQCMVLGKDIFSIL